jgi:polyisoprenoid-binding protein YceI
MHTRLRISALVVLVPWIVACSNPADGVTEAEVREADGAATEVALEEGVRYVVDETSTVEWTGSKVTGHHDGGFRAFAGEILVVDDDPERSTVDLVIDTTSLWADNDRLTGHLKSEDFFDVETHPEARFKSTSIRATEDGWEVTGNLDLHGVQKSITFPATIEVGADQVTARAEFFLKRFDWDIVYPGKPDDLIRDEVVVRFDLTAKPLEG